MARTVLHAGMCECEKQNARLSAGLVDSAVLLVVAAASAKGVRFRALRRASARVLDLCNVNDVQATSEPAIVVIY